jgi:hypothetical protein
MLRGLSQSIQAKPGLHLDAGKATSFHMRPFISHIRLTGNISFIKQPTKAKLFHTLYPRVGAKT